MLAAADKALAGHSRWSKATESGKILDWYIILSSDNLIVDKSFRFWFGVTKSKWHNNGRGG